MKYFFILLYFLFIVIGQNNAQSFNNGFDVPIELLQRVNSIESFIKRFNYQEDLNGNMLPEMKISPDNITKRNNFILSLFDYEKLSVTDSLGKTKILSFLKKVNSIQHQVKLDFYDKGWYAEVLMDVIYKKQPQQLTLILVNEQSQPKISHWAIKAVKADFLDIYKGQAKNDTAVIIPPNSHGTDFIGVPQQFTNYEMIKNFTSSSIKPDLLSIFLYASQNGEIEFKLARNITYHFLQINDWILTVKEIVRNSPNSGWLVADLIKADKENKKQYESKFLNLHNQ